MRPPVTCHLSPVILSLLLLLSACTPTQPVAKIGLIAPFEGLYRRSGYEALAAVRAAIADHPVPGVGIVPLALDDSADPALARRAMAKLAVDPAVAAVVGPLSPATAAVVAGDADAAPARWLLPFAVPSAPEGVERADGEDAWAIGLVKRAAALAVDQGAQGLVLAGWTPGWPVLTAEAWSAQLGLPARLSDGPEAVEAGEAVFWMGSADGGATYLHALRRLNPESPFWMGPQGGDPVFAEHAQEFDRVYWVIWTDSEYTAWSTAHTPSSPAAYLVYRATADAISSVAGGLPAQTGEWFVQAYAFGPDGVSVRYPPMP